MTDPTLTESRVVPGDATLIPVPSGQVVTLLDVIWNAPGPLGLTTRFRFLAPAINKAAPQVEFEEATVDMMHLCQSYALGRIAEFGPAPAQIIISLSDTPVHFGEAAPGATQFFEAYSLQDGACIWEAF